jgi:hypothetical protein
VELCNREVNADTRRKQGMEDLTIALENRPGALAEMGEAMGARE